MLLHWGLVFFCVQAGTVNTSASSNDSDNKNLQSADSHRSLVRCGITNSYRQVLLPGRWFSTCAKLPPWLKTGHFTNAVLSPVISQNNWLYVLNVFYLFCCSKKLAKMLGYANYAEMSLSSKMAGSVENVFSMIDRWVCCLAYVIDECSF